MAFMDLACRVVCNLPTTPNNQRNSEGCFIRLKDNSVLYAWSNYYGDGEDLGQADIGCIRSYDEGETWVERRILFGDGQENLMCPHLLRMKNGDLGLIYVLHVDCKNGVDKYGRGYNKGILHITRSKDEGLTWSEPLRITNPDECYCFENGHGITLKSGRILLPMAYHRYDPKGYGGTSIYGVITFYMSDDDGYTWFEGPQRVYGLPEDVTETGLQEPAPYQTESGRIRVFCRTDLGVQYETYSDDDGMTWSPAVPNRRLSSPCSPMVMKRAGKYTVAVMNPIPRYNGRDLCSPFTGGDDRNPLVVLISEDDGATFSKIKMIDPRVGGQYPDLFDGGDYFLVGYQIINEGVIAKGWTNDGWYGLA